MSRSPSLERDPALNKLDEILGCFEKTAYRNYVANTIRASAPGRAGDSFQKNVDLFAEVIRSKETIGNLISRFRSGHGGGIVLAFIGVWQSVYHSFQPLAQGFTPVEIAYCVAHRRRKMSLQRQLALKEAFNETPADLLSKSKILPGPKQLDVTKRITDPFDVLGPLEAASVSCKSLNMYTLCSFAGVKIHWTTNLSRHLLLSKRDGKDILEIYSLPSMFKSSTPAMIGLGNMELALEVRLSYASLFNPYQPKHRGVLSRMLQRKKWCWCRHCMLARMRDVELKGLKHDRGHAEQLMLPTYDETIQTLMAAHAVDWEIGSYNYLWTRVEALEKFLRCSKPWGFRVLFRDNRNTAQYWTFV
ncbi:hypothetical protein K432DRAFT_430714 [Lepidopterella palustris CBS 459.81]|uniref:Uncharacterized protein n=1 Tax=Lepidopterella palustris CBS 459.81 TaxID=1314670 RepID=A0A8E2DX51_9PEZI|nr:hypothetical protein K432DRAFT_430714 [Lepidopterella palustris CBS 459.81]